MDSKQLQQDVIDIKATLAKCKRIDGKGWHRSLDPFQERAGTTFNWGGGKVEKVNLSKEFDSPGPVRRSVPLLYV